MIKLSFFGSSTYSKQFYGPLFYSFYFRFKTKHSFSRNVCQVMFLIFSTLLLFFLSHHHEVHSWAAWNFCNYLLSLRVHYCCIWVFSSIGPRWSQPIQTDSLIAPCHCNSLKWLRLNHNSSPTPPASPYPERDGKIKIASSNSDVTTAPWYHQEVTVIYVSA